MVISRSVVQCRLTDCNGTNQTPAQISCRSLYSNWLTRGQHWTRAESDVYNCLVYHYRKAKGSLYSITKCRVPELIPVLGSQHAGDVSHKPSGRLPLLSDRPIVTLATLKRAATNFAAWWTEVWWVWTVCLRILPDSVTAAIWTQALLRLSPVR